MLLCYSLVKYSLLAKCMHFWHGTFCLSVALQIKVITVGMVTRERKSNSKGISISYDDFKFIIKYFHRDDWGKYERIMLKNYWVSSVLVTMPWAFHMFPYIFNHYYFL